MRITRISGTNIEGATFALDLGDLNLIYGPNFSGKTRVRHAIELALLGYVPGLDKKAQDIFKLSSGQTMEVEATMIERLGANAAELQESRIERCHEIHRSWSLKGGTVSAKHHVPKQLDGAVPLVAMDAGDYFSRSARGRVELVFSAAKIERSGDFVSEILSEMKRETGYGFVAADASKLPIQEWLDGVLQSAEEKRSEAAASVRRFGGTIQGLSALQLDEKAPQRSVEVIDAEIATVQQDIGRLAANKEEAEKLLREAETDALERERLEHKIAQAGDPVPREFNIEELRSKERLLKEQIAQSENRRLKHDLWREQVENCAKQAQEKRDEISSLEAENPSISDDEVCSECGRPYYITEQEKEKELKRRKTRLEWRIKQTRDWLATLQIPIPEPTPPSNTMVWEAELKDVQAEIDEYTRTADVQVWRKQLAALQPKTFVLPGVYAGQITEATDRAEQLKKERRLAEADRNDRKRLAEARAEHEKALADEARYKAAKKFLLAKKEELIGQVFGPLLETANRLAEGIMPHQIYYDSGEFGYRLPAAGHWVSADTFSGTEQALLYLSLQAALGAQSPCRILMVDELSRLDRANWLLFLMNVHDAQEAGLIEQFVGFTPRMEHAEQLKGMGFRLIEATGSSYREAALQSALAEA